MWIRVRERPLGAAAMISSAGMEIAYFPLRRPDLLPMQGMGATSSLLLGSGLVGCAVILLARPRRARPVGAVAVGLGLVSVPLANLGGFLLGMVLAALGGALAMAWRVVPSSAPEQGG
ncbi:DUF6114 domain-containing protein [Kitasatospora sp. NPDC058046]|uniref:DUF6114 domain-containing protein n=1 Tax=Kitasatospora sp. NPDC058046 TaxID=3346312 RepID=UPI0036DC1E63